MTRLRRGESAGYLVNHLARQFAVRANAALNPLGFSTAPFGILLELWANDGLTQNDIVVRLDLEQATVANTLKRMERDRLIVRRAAPGDRRAKTIHLTARARALEESATACARKVNRAVMAALNPAEREVFLGMLHRLIAA